MSIIKNIQLPSGTEYPVAFFRGTCDTAAATVEKAATCSKFAAADLVKGAIILVTFDYTNSDFLNLRKTIFFLEFICSTSCCILSH